MMFRAATATDAPAIARIVNAAYRGVEGQDGWTTESHLVEGLRTTPPEVSAMMEDPSATFALASADDGTLLGSVYLRRESARVCYLGMLSVDPARQAEGVGRALLAHADDVARGWGCHAMRITVLDVRDELIAYYERRGYRRTSRVEPFPASARSRLKVAGIQLVEMEKALGARG